MRLLTIAGYQFGFRSPIRFYNRLPRHWHCPSCRRHWRFDQCPKGCCPRCAVGVRRNEPPTKSPKASADSGRSATPDYIVPMMCGYRRTGLTCFRPAGHGGAGHLDPNLGYWEELT